MRILVALPGTGVNRLDWEYRLDDKPWLVCEYKGNKYTNGELVDPMRMVSRGTMSAISFLDHTWKSCNLLGYIPIIDLPPATEFAKKYFTEQFDFRIVARTYESIVKVENHWLETTEILASKEAYLRFVNNSVNGYGDVFWINEDLNRFMEENSLW